MTPKIVFAITTTSVYLLIFLFFISMNYSTVASWMFLFSPIVILWLAYMIIKNGEYTGSELGPEEEWGYEDKKKEDLGIF